MDLENKPPLTDAHGNYGNSAKYFEALATGALRRSSYPEVRYIWCEWHDGVLTLRGQVSNFYLKQIAQSIVLQRLEGIVTLDNQVEVIPAATTVEA